MRYQLIGGSTHDRAIVLAATSVVPNDAIVELGSGLARSDGSVIHDCRRVADDVTNARGAE